MWIWSAPCDSGDRRGGRSLQYMLLEESRGRYDDRLDENEPAPGISNCDSEVRFVM